MKQKEKKKVNKKKKKKKGTPTKLARPAGHLDIQEQCKQRPWPLTSNSENNCTQWGFHIQHVWEVSEQSDQNCGV